VARWERLEEIKIGKKDRRCFPSMSHNRDENVGKMYLLKLLLHPHSLGIISVDWKKNPNPSSFPVVLPIFLASF
jgi:hypothetical protein